MTLCMYMLFSESQKSDSIVRYSSSVQTQRTVLSGLCCETQSLSKVVWLWDTILWWQTGKSCSISTISFSQSECIRSDQYNFKCYKLLKINFAYHKHLKKKTKKLQNEKVLHLYHFTYIQGAFGWDFNGSSNLEELMLLLKETIMIR